MPLHAILLSEIISERTSTSHISKYALVIGGLSWLLPSWLGPLDIGGLSRLFPSCLGPFDKGGLCRFLPSCLGPLDIGGLSWFLPSWLGPLDMGGLSWLLPSWLGPLDIGGLSWLFPSCLEPVIFLLPQIFLIIWLFWFFQKLTVDIKFDYYVIIRVKMNNLHYLCSGQHIDPLIGAQDNILIH